MVYVLKHRSGLYLQYYLGKGLGVINTGHRSLASKFRSRQEALDTANRHGLLFDYHPVKLSVG